MSESSASDSIIEQAAHWLVRLSADDACADDHVAFENWKRADPRHAEAANRMAGLIDRVRKLDEVVADPGHVRVTLDVVCPGKRSHPKRALATLAVVVALMLAGWMGQKQLPLTYLFADMRTATGQPETRYLADNSRITLKGASAVNLRFDASRRTLNLLCGEILLDVAPEASRPFIVETRHGRIQALGTQFAVRVEDDATVLTMLESKVSINASEAEDRDGIVVSAGERVRIGSRGPGIVERIDPPSISNAWKFNQLVVRDALLPDVLDELARQRVGVIRYDRAALASIRVSAVLPLGDTDQALRLLATSLQLRITSFTPWLVFVSTAP